MCERVQISVAEPVKSVDRRETASFRDHFSSSGSFHTSGQYYDV
jgi:hypothetical protein